MSKYYTLIFGSNELWRERALAGAIRASKYPIYTLEKSIVDHRRAADGVVIGLPDNPEGILENIFLINSSEKIFLDRIIPLFEGAIDSAFQISEKLGTPYLSKKCVQNIRNKNSMRKAFKENGIPVPNFHQISLDNVQNCLKFINFPAVIKPVNAGGSLGVELVERSEDLEKIFKDSKRTSEKLSEFGIQISDFIIEDFIHGESEVSVEVLCSKSGYTTLGVCDKIKSPLPKFIELGHVFPSVFSENSQITKLAEESCRVLGIDRGVAHVELIISPEQQPMVVEVNGRPCGGGINEIIEKVAKVNLYELHCASYCDPEWILETPPNASGSAAVIYPKAPIGKIESVNAHDVCTKFNDIYSIKTLLSSGDFSTKAEDNFCRDAAVFFYRSEDQHKLTPTNVNKKLQEITHALFEVEGV